METIKYRKPTFEKINENKTQIYLGKILVAEIRKKDNEYIINYTFLEYLHQIVKSFEEAEVLFKEAYLSFMKELTDIYDKYDAY